MRPRHLPVLLAALAVALPAVTTAQSSAIDWDYLGMMDSDYRQLILKYQESVRETRRLALELSHTFPSPLLRLELRRDLSRIRWRIADPLSGAGWTEALVCPADRNALAKLENVVIKGSARAEWVRMRISGDRLLTNRAWGQRALLVREDGAVLRLMIIEP